MKRITVVASITALIALSSGAREAPNPLVFLANMSSLQDRCVYLHLATKDDLVKLEAQSSGEDWEIIRLLKTSPEYGPILANAQAEIMKMPMEKVQTECKSMHEQANLEPVRGRF